MVTLRKNYTKNVTYFYVSKFSDIENQIIPVFKKYYLQGSKRLDFEDFCKVIPLIKGKKKHLTG